MKVKGVVVSIFTGLMIIFSSCGGGKPANTANTAAPTTSPAAANTNTASAPPSTNSGRPDVTVTGKWELVGKEGEWKGTVDMVGMDGFIWSVEKDGSLYKTDPATGSSSLLGEKGSFQNLKLIEGMDHMLWTVEGDSLYKE